MFAYTKPLDVLFKTVKVVYNIYIWMAGRTEESGHHFYEKN